MAIGRLGLYWELNFVKSERPDLPQTIARLVRSATPVTRLEAPSVRLARWAITSAALVMLTVGILGVRADVTAQIVNGWFVARATATLAIVIAASIVVFLMSVPGGEPSPLARTVPLAACLVWAAILLGSVAATPSPIDHLLQVRPHPSCVLLITATALLPAVVLVRMLQDAAPLRAAWTSGLAGLASLAIGALGTQFVCTDDSAAHQLVWHLTPVALLTLASIAVGSSVLRWPHRRLL